MGLFEQKICIFTGLETRPIINGIDAIEYFVKVNGQMHLMRLPRTAVDWKDDPFFVSNKRFFEGLLYNNDWIPDENEYISLDLLKSLLESKSFPTKPEDKFENLFSTLYSCQTIDGQWVRINREYYDNLLWKKLYFKTLSELNYYVVVLSESGLIDIKLSEAQDRKDLLESFRVTYKGLQHAVKIATEGDKSNKCFIAMAFRPETIKIRNSIKQALNETGFQPVIIDEENIESERTINDEIISSIKKCRFCIADFSYHSNGVYFESGFALGLGKKVIYVCNEEEFAKSHFDLRPLQHIIYKKEEDLKKALKLKIEAWIK